MKIFGKDELLAEACGHNVSSVVSALATGALYSFQNNEQVVLIPAEDFDMSELSGVLTDLLLELTPWKGSHPNAAIGELIEGYEIECLGGYEPLLQGYCIEHSSLKPTNTYEIYDDGSVSYHMQTQFEAFDVDYRRGNQLFATLKDAEYYLLHGEYKDFDMKPVEHLPFVCHNQGTYHTVEIEDSGEETYRTYNFTYWLYTLESGWCQGTPPDPTSYP
jgi:hypothetical protein